jgi:hypothetical protein
MKLPGIVSVDFNITDQIFFISQIYRQTIEYNGMILQLLLTLKKSVIHFGDKYCTTFSVGMILTEFSMPLKLLQPIKI